MTTGDDIELTINITDPDGAAVDLDGCLFSIAIKGVYFASWYLSTNEIVIPNSVTTDWPSGTYPIQYKLTLTDGTEVYSDIDNTVIKDSLIKGDNIEENNNFPYSFPISF